MMFHLYALKLPRSQKTIQVRHVQNPFPKGQAVYQHADPLFETIWEHLIWGELVQQRDFPMVLPGAYSERFLSVQYA